MERQQAGPGPGGTPEMDRATRRERGGRSGQVSDLERSDERVVFAANGRREDPDIESGDVRDDEGLFTPIEESGPEPGRSDDARR